MPGLAQLYANRYGNPNAQPGVEDVQSLPSPIGGWNARDSLANMEPTDAVTLINQFPNVSNVELRGGYQRWATGLPGQVNSLFAYSGGSTSELWAATANGSFYDVSSAGAVGAPAVTGLTNGSWEYSNITTAAGDSFIACVNGFDDLELYDGSSWTAINTGSSPAITGVATADLSNITLFKNRLWFIEKDTLKAWYLPTNSIAGVAQYLDLSSVAKQGGHLIDLDTWTLDAGYGVDDNLAFITSEGEVIVYRGTDPASAATWALAGVWKLGSPIGHRSMLKWAGDLLLLTFDGLLPLAAALQSSRLDPRVALSDKIQGAIAAATTLYGGTHASIGWQVYYNAKVNAVWINVPVAADMQQQYVMNTITSSWCQFTGWGANVWETFSDEPYFGGNGYVGLAWTTDGADAYADNGANINTQTIQAFNYYGSRGMKKKFTRARPSIFTNGTPTINVGMNIDFDLSNTVGALSFAPITYGLWDTGVWDTAVWGQGLVISAPWLGISAYPGYCGALQMQTASMGTVIQWSSTDIVYQTGWAGV